MLRLNIQWIDPCGFAELPRNKPLFPSLPRLFKRSLSSRQ